MKLIPLTRGKSAKVDDHDYEWLNRHRWYCNAYGYAVRFKTVDGKRRSIWMHREVNQTPEGFVTDHVNRDRLDNRRTNLRTATGTNNLHNARKRKGKTTSSFKGVFWFTPAQLWVARFKSHGKEILMYFDTEIEAAYAYNILAAKFAGAFFTQNYFSGGQLTDKIRRNVEQRVEGRITKGLHKRNKTGVKGVSWSKAANKWIAYHGKKYVGVFEDKGKAGRAIDQYARQTLNNTRSGL